MTSPIYSHPWIYEFLMHFLYWGHYTDRIQAAAGCIPQGVSVADICAGDCSLFRYGLRDRSVEYRAYDINPRFVHWAEKQGISMQLLDVRKDEIPSADCVVMLSALYQFIPNERIVLNKLMHSAKRMVVLTEPIHNVAQNRYSAIGWLGRSLTRVGDNPCVHRFNEEQLRALLADCGFQSIASIAGGRELLGIYTR